MSSAERWDAYVTAHPRATVYHLSPWAKILGEPNRLRPRYIALERADGSVQGVLPLVAGSGAVLGRRLVSLPGVRCSGPLADSRDGELALVARACSMAAETGAPSLEIRSFSNDLGDPRAQVHPETPEWMIELPDDEEAFLRRVRQRSRRLSKYLRALDRSPLEVRWSTSPDDLRRLYSMLLVTLRRVRVLPKGFGQFRLWLELLAPRGIAGLLLAELNGELIGGLTATTFGDTVDLSWIGTDRRRADLRPDYLLYLSAIRWAIANGYRRLDFGGATPGSSLATFKERWTAEPVPRFRHLWLFQQRGAAAERLIRPAVQLESAIPPALQAVWDRTPAQLTRLAGVAAYRYL